MANKSINTLDNTSTLADADLLVLWKASANAAYNISGADFKAMLLSMAAGHGGIASIAKTGTAGLVDTYTITYEDGNTSTYTVTNGATGATGAQTYVWVAYSTLEPTSDAEISILPAPWMGIYCGLESTQANLHYTDYTWYEIKGPKGDGVAYTALSSTVGLTKTYSMYTADGTVVGTFSVTDGEGGVSTVNGIAPDDDGNVPAIVSSVADLELNGTPLVVGSATISDAYSALQTKQILIAPASDFATGELPLINGNRINDGSIEIVKGDGTDGWIEFHGRQRTVGDFKMFFNQYDVPLGNWICSNGVLYKDFTVTLSANANVSPYSYAGTKSLSSDIPAGCKIVSTMGIGTSAGVVLAQLNTSETGISAYGHAAGDVTVRVGFAIAY